MSDFENFLTFEVENSGERKKIKIEQKELQNLLHPEQVLVIVREDLRRIYIWKGAKSPVRKRFISVRIARDLQTELQNDSRYHRCKIVSIDQGDELNEFLNAFNLESMEVTEKLEDMRYVRNIDRGKIQETKIFNTKPKTEKKEKTKEIPYISPALQDISNEPVKSSISLRQIRQKERQMINPSMITQAIGQSEEQRKRIMEKILKIKVSENYERQNLVLGHALYGAVLKNVKIFGENIEATEWEVIKKIPKKIIELENHKLRIYCNIDKGLVEAIEILKKKEGKKQDTKKIKPTVKKTPKKKPEPLIDYKSWTVKDLKNYCVKNSIEFPGRVLKADIIKLIKESLKNNSKLPKKKTPRTRQLPKIPKAD
ncbi:MAG: hypothetical protein ACTSUT_17680 [Promethearchaeota archaeon]